VLRSDLTLALLVGVVQGALEWLPVSSQGNVALLVTLLTDVDPTVAVDLALFVQVGTILSASTDYREDIAATVASAPKWRLETAYGADHVDLTFVVVASAATAVVGIPIYFAFRQAVSGLAGATFIALVGGLLVLTGLLQRATEALDIVGRTRPTFSDTLLVGVLQGFAILPGVSRSGTTVSVLLLRVLEAALDGVDAGGRPSPCYCSGATGGRSRCGSAFSSRFRQASVQPASSSSRLAACRGSYRFRPLWRS